MLPSAAPFEPTSGVVLMEKQLLQRYAPPVDWDRGSWRLRLGWFLIGKPLLASWLPGTAWRKQLLRMFGACLGCGGRVKPRVHITSPWMLRVGDHCWLGEDLWIDNLAPVMIGDQVCLSQGVYLCTGNHDYRSSTFDLRLGPITIDDQAWIAAKAVLAPGTHVGVGAVVVLGAVVSGVIPAGAIVRGNPAVVVGQR